MNQKLHKVLGLAITGNSILAAEMSMKAGRAAASHLAEFNFPEGLSLAKPEQLGAAFGKFLKQEKIATRDVVIGLPAKRLLTRRKEVPPAAPEMAASAIRLQAESEFSSELEDLVMDFAGETSASQPASVLLIATARSLVDQCMAFAKAAGVRVHAVTATAAALSNMTSRIPGGDGIIVSLTPGSAELIVQHGKSPAQVRHLNLPESPTPESLSGVISEIRRTVAGLSRNGNPMTLALWSDSNHSTSSLLEQRLAIPVTAPLLSTVVSTQAANADAFAPAISVALSALDAAGTQVDFLNSRLAPPVEKSNRRLYTWLIILGTVILIAIGSGVVDLYMKQSELDSYTKFLSANDQEIKAARAEANRLQMVRKWNTGKPQFVACLRDLTNSFPDEAIWATTITLNRKGKEGQLTGKAANTDLVLRLFSKIRANPMFKGVNHYETSEGGPNSRDVTFSIKFTYTGIVE